jgi:ribonucleotide monophosphatase NagD (HAD superfamily)
MAAESHNSSGGVFGGFLFDMDGTLIDSTEAIVKFWQG